MSIRNRNKNVTDLIHKHYKNLFYMNQIKFKKPIFLWL
ncbi:hypothetical protein LEP1GSC150_1591 [Leptospira interrogans serovar Copenhageni str. LT2050]|uniref:Uncharacterized protein n=1 Tax=Leptospira interrogans serovar Copenhageni str. LT2050 TaxID=1001598 RepID=M3IHW8_LEPIT|nr:hypothetical protein LEP1GSC150_1591 [Leptospira interrogans serovar Copenhageni str. LT2050]